MVLIRHPFFEEMEEVAEILLIGFYDKFSFIFKDNLELGKKIYNELYFKYLKNTDLPRYFIAVQNNKILGTIQYHTKSKFPKLAEILSIFKVLIRNFRFVNFLRKFLILFFMKMEHVEKNCCYISSFAVKPEARNKGIGRKLLNAVEEAALKQNCKYITLDVIFRNVKARKLYKKLGYEITETMSSSLFIYFMGINGSCHMKKKLKSK